MSAPARKIDTALSSVQNSEVSEFWEENPVAASSISAEPGSPEFFAAFDALREAEDCEPYDYSNRIHGYETSAGLRVLDVGCGNGYVLSQYARFGAEVAGVDITNRALSLTAERFAQSGLHGDFHLTDGDSLPYDNESFDVVCSMGVLHHIEDARPMVGEIFRVLKPGGTVILMLYYRYSWKNLIVLRLRRIFDSKYRGKSQAEALNMNDGNDCPLARVYSRREARALLGQFEGHQTQLNQLSWKQLFLSSAIARMLGPILPSCNGSIFARAMGWNLYIHARKPESQETI